MRTKLYIIYKITIGDVMNRFVKYEKIIFAVILVLALVFAIAIPVCAEAMQSDSVVSTTSDMEGEAPVQSGGSVLSDPMF